MAIDYDAISSGHDFEKMLVSVTRNIIVPLYEDPTHFIFELLQNAEDALSKRVGPGPDSVSFELQADGLKISHFGKPFDVEDIRAISSVGNSTKDRESTDIGKFGIGFKSVYSVSNRPEVHSGDKHFAIEDYVRPVRVEPLPLKVGETIFWLPFKPDIGDAAEKIRIAIESLPASTLLFIRQIREIRWSLGQEKHGSFFKLATDHSDSIQRVELKLGLNGQEQASEYWLVCSRPVYHEGIRKGAVELAFQLADSSSDIVVKPLNRSKLVAFFPTIVEAKLGFLVQAPFQTTPSRESIPANETWNQYLVEELATLLVDSLVKLRDLGALSLDLLSTLPLNQNDFPKSSLLAPLYDATKNAFQSNSLLPTAHGKWVEAQNALIARGDELRKLLRAEHLELMFGTTYRKEWLSDKLTRERFPVLHRYLLSVQDISEISPSDCIAKWQRAFLESQSDSWINELFSFLLSQSALMRERSFRARPWVRMEDGTHRAPFSGDQPIAFLPAQEGESGFPTVRRSLLKSKETLEFYTKLGLTQPDPVDDVIAHVLPRYSGKPVQGDLKSYKADIERLLTAAKTDSTKQLNKLTSAAKDKKFVHSVDGSGRIFWASPTQVYLSTASLKALFTGVEGVLLVDADLECLRGDGIRTLLRRLGASAYLDTFEVNVLSEAERSRLRGGKGTESQTIDRDIRGLQQVLTLISRLPREEAVERSRLLWDALRDLVRESRETILYGTHHWYYYSPKSTSFLAHFVTRLRNAKWIPDENGNLVRPVEAVFERIERGWPENAALQKVLGFKPPILEILAKEIGVEPEMLTFLAQKGIKTKADLMEKLGLSDGHDTTGEEGTASSEAGDGTGDGSGNDQGGGRVGPSGLGSGGGSSRQLGGSGSSGSRVPSSGASSSSTSSYSQAGRTEFFSYLKTHPVEVEGDEFSDSETREQRMKVEAVAIDHILSLESDLQRTPAGNKGYDLYSTDNDGQTNRWIEVKAMVGTLASHPVGMSKAQFEMALEKGFQYWLYIVEQATSEQPRILKIQDPAGNARTFTFDEGWREIALVSQVNSRADEEKT